MFAGVTAEKLVGGLLPGGQIIQNFHKGEIYLIGKNYLRKKLLLGEIFVT